MKVFGIKNGVEGFLHEFGIGDAEASRHDGTDVAEDAFADLIGELSHELIGEDKVEAVFAGFAEDTFETLGGEVLELVDEETEVGAIIFRGVGATHGGGLKFHDEDHAEEFAVEFAHFAF